jgi:hypothetical protein
VLRSDGGTQRVASAELQGAEAVASRAMRFAMPDAVLHPVVVNGTAGVVVTLRGQPFSVMGFTVVEGRIVEIDAIADPERVRRIAAPVLDR